MFYSSLNDLQKICKSIETSKAGDMNVDLFLSRCFQIGNVPKSADMLQQLVQEVELHREQS